MTAAPRITTELRDHVLSIGLHRPDKRNAFDLAMLRGLAEALTRGEDDPEVRCHLLFGHGEQAEKNAKAAEVAVEIAKPLAGVNKRVLAAIAASTDALGRAAGLTADGAASHYKRLEVATSELSLPPRHLADHVDRTLLEARSFKKRTLLGAPRIRAELGLGGLEARIGLSAHDFAMALGAPEVLLTRARRDARSLGHMLRRPAAPETPPGAWQGFGSAVADALPYAANTSVSAWSAVMEAYGHAAAYRDAPTNALVNAEAPPAPAALQAQTLDRMGNSETARGFREQARRYAPDPASVGIAGQVVHGLISGMAKMTAYAGAGPAGPAAERGAWRLIPKRDPQTMLIVEVDLIPV